MPFPPLVDPVDELGDDDLRRHARQLILADIGAVGQRRLQNSKVLVVDADEIGGPVLAHLADSGVGQLGIIDTEPFGELDRYLGMPRAESASKASNTRADRWAEELRISHPTVSTVVHAEGLNASDAASILDRYDVIVSASEDPARCYLLDDACAALGKPFVWAGVDRLRGRTSVFWDRNGPTYRDLHPQPPALYFRGMAGFLKILGASMAAAMTAETVKLITGCGEPLVGRVLENDVRSGRCSDTPLTRKPMTSRPAQLTAAEPFFGLLSPAAAEAARESTISVEELKSLLDGEAPLCLVDVREADEHEFCDLPGSVLMPKGDFLDGDAAGRLPQDRKVVLFCRAGIRSAEVLAVVKKHGHPDAVHLGGGILDWAERIDPGLPVY
ncbi:ThiF family adenylyltransferase [Streptomyces albidus (ex Kaewkla and Franco 2022)]|uniref:ThiF family adenylyltransferase n=1 Tax=Streptomyces albidus (ex Kaewkla and Franco 2022) TaxID=722709 RepID=UPI0015EF1F32|nr:ThiF family adenylyltransferase [Streptomyces albidus (ex Kaewkla and Franco 2022)]